MFSFFWYFTVKLFSILCACFPFFCRDTREGPLTAYKGYIKSQILTTALWEASSLLFAALFAFLFLAQIYWLEKLLLFFEKLLPVSRNPYPLSLIWVSLTCCYLVSILCAFPFYVSLEGILPCLEGRHTTKGYGILLCACFPFFCREGPLTAYKGYIKSQILCIPCMLWSLRTLEGILSYPLLVKGH